MRHSLPVALALAVFTVAGANGPASAIDTHLNPWGVPLIKEVQTKPPKSNTNQNPSAMQSTKNSPAITSKPPKSNANQNPSATQTTPNPPATTSKPPAAQTSKPLTVAELKKDIAEQQDYLKRVQKTAAGDADRIKRDLAANKYHWDPKNPKQMKCDSSGKCVGYWTVELADTTTVAPGKGILKITTKVFEVPVDQTGAPLPGAQDVLVQAYKVFHDNQVAFIQARIAADYAANPLMLGGGTIQAPPASTASHQK